MVTSFFEYPEPLQYIENRYIPKKLDGGDYVVTIDDGAWALLSKSEYNLLKTHRVSEDPELFKKLENLGIILTKSNPGKIVDDYSARFAHVFNGTSLHIVALTPRCTQRCLYCYVNPQPLSSKGFDMDEDTAKKVVDFIFQSPASTITIEFQGGEPLLNFPILQYIVEYSKKLNKKYKKHLAHTVVTNLTVMSEDILNYLIKSRVAICTSLDGPKEVHDKNRRYLGGGGTHDDVVHWIKDIRTQFAYNVHALPVITRFSLPYAKEIVDEYMGLGLDRIRIKHIIYCGLARENWDKIGYTPDEYINFWKEVLDYCFRLNKNGKKLLEGTSVLIARKLLSRDYEAFTCLGWPCGAALSQTSYNYNGDIRICDESRSFEEFKIGSVKSDDYRSVYTSPKALNAVALTCGLNSLCDACVWHPYCNNCLVSSFGQQGNPISKLPLDYDCKIRKGLVDHVFKTLVYSEENRKILLEWCSTKFGV
ncbi:His-Xaa-Ser system radical SAM maturase HxsB [Candidatus Micrarchaeota archaeon]|nr:His-Xaa-Ser system radical SAM maturase HxsB [Candidatus Micrarchaeota archaeon]